MYYNELMRCDRETEVLNYAYLPKRICAFVRLFILKTISVVTSILQKK